MMGDLARQDDYYDPMTGLQLGTQADPPQDPREFTAGWARVSGVHPQPFEPLGTMWPQYPPPEPKAVPEDRPNPLIPFSAYRSLPPKHSVADIAAEQLISTGPAATGFGLATGTMLRGAGPLMRSTAGGVVGSAEPSEAEAHKLRLPSGFRPGLGTLAHPGMTTGNWMFRHGPEGAIMADEGTHGFSALRTGKIPEDMQYGITGQSPVPSNVIDIADLEGKNVLLGVTDPTIGGGQVTEVGGRKITPVTREGGSNYSFLHENTSIPGVDDPEAVRLFASASKAAAGKLVNEAERVAQQTGEAPLFMTTLMARGSGDSSKQMARTAYRTAKASDLSEAAVTKLDDQVRSILAADEIKTTTPYPGFHDAEQWLENEGLKARGAFVKALDTKGVGVLGGPDVGEVRAANFDPRYRNTPTGSVGGFVGKTRPDLGYATSDIHSNYPYEIYGERAGRGALAGNVPFHIFAPDLHRHLLAAGDPRRFANVPAGYIMGNMPGGVPKVQKVTGEVVDNVSEFFRRYPKGFAFAGGAPIMGALASQGDYQEP
jgi:hypothetical protein